MAIIESTSSALEWTSSPRFTASIGAVEDIRELQ